MSFIIPTPTKYLENSKSKLELNEKISFFCTFPSIERVFCNNFKTQGIVFKKSESVEKSTIRITINEKQTNEFEIRVENSIVSITSPQETGLLYGCQVFFQICLFHEFNIPEIEVIEENAPFFKHRGLLFDCCRHFFPVDFVKKVLDLLSIYRFNVFHFHLTEDQGWRIESKKYPKLTEYVGDEYYSHEQIKDIIAYANERGIEVIPEIEMPGHTTSAIVSYPELSCRQEQLELPVGKWGVFRDVYCIGNTKLYPFISGILEEVIELFGHQTNKIHVGADECPTVRWSLCKKCNDLMKKEKMARARELQHYFIRWVARFLSSKKMILIGWDEILHDNIINNLEDKLVEEEEEEEEEDEEEKKKKSLNNICVQVWRGHGYLERAISLGVKVIYSPTSNCYFDYKIEKLHLKQVYSINPFRNIHKKFWNLIQGIECNVWSERIPDGEKWENMVFPRILAISEKCCNGNFGENCRNEKFLEYDDFVKIVRNHYKILKLLGVNYGREGFGVL